MGKEKIKRSGWHGRLMGAVGSRLARCCGQGAWPEAAVSHLRLTTRNYLIYGSVLGQSMSDKPRLQGLALALRISSRALRPAKPTPRPGPAQAFTARLPGLDGFGPGLAHH